ncbi:RNA 2',3'-cyclic phosphodiesterase [Rhodovibrionaceae bacterium A322]
MRLFVALRLPYSLHDRLSQLCCGLPGARWVRPENFHLTLRFLGDLDEHSAADVDAALQGISLPAFDLQLEGMGTFTEGKRLKALWAGVQPNPALNHLQSKVEKAIIRAGLPLERRKFKPHVTLARFKGQAPVPRLDQYLQANALLRTAPFPVQDFVLYSSILTHDGAHYEPEVIYPLERESLQAMSL